MVGPLMSPRPRLTVALAVAAASLIVAAIAAAATGKLTYKGCISGESDHAVEPCTLIQRAAPDGTGSGLNGVESVTVSLDGKWVYAVARGDDSIARLRRDRDTGELSYRGCLSGDLSTPDPG
jgi:hypothetical protein